LVRWENVRKRFCNTVEKQILAINEKPHKVALGCALGVGINFFPTLGIGFIFAFILALLLRINRASAAVTSLVTGPLVPVMYALNLLIGGFILTPVTGKENIIEFVINQYSLILTLGNFREKAFGFLDFFGSTFLVGAVANAAAFGVACYFFVRFLLNNRSK